MDWTTYKVLCDQPDIWSRWMLEQTISILDDGQRSSSCAQSRAPLAEPDLDQELVSDCRSELVRALSGKVIDQPPGHKGDARTDMFCVVLNGFQVDTIVECVLAARARTTRGSERRLGGFVEAWQEYQRSLKRDEGVCSRRS